MTSAGQKIYHFDLYRITSVQDFIDAGFDEYLHDANAYIFIEWPEVIKDILPEERVCFIDLEYVSEKQRSIAMRNSL